MMMNDVMKTSKSSPTASHTPGMPGEDKLTALSLALYVDVDELPCGEADAVRRDRDEGAGRGYERRGSP